MLPNRGTLKGKTLFITGASRGIGKAIALKAARDGANVVIAAKTAEPHPKLAGTIFSTAKEVEQAGGQALPVVVDVRFEDQVKKAVDAAVKKFGGIDIVVNNASAISLTPTLDTDMKRYDLMHNINTRGTFLVSKECIPHLLKSDHAHILNICPSVEMNPMWFAPHVAYSMAKFGMSMCVLGMAEEFKDRHISVNGLWPHIIVHTAAVDAVRGQEAQKRARKVDIMADAAYAILCSRPAEVTGKFFTDEEVLLNAGIQDFDAYRLHPENQETLLTTLFIRKQCSKL